MIFLKFLLISCSMLQLMHYGESKISESCFSSINQDETPKVIISLTCGMQNISRINSIIFLRPVESGDSNCGGIDAEINCCNFRITEPTCSVYLAQQDEQFINTTQCQHQKFCEKAYEVKRMDSCNKDCNSEKTNTDKTCLSRIIQIDYECETERQGRNETRDCDKESTETTASTMTASGQCTPCDCECEKITTIPEPTSTIAPNQCAPCVCSSTTEQPTIITADITSVETSTSLQTSTAYQDTQNYLTETSEAMISSPYTSKDGGSGKSEAQVEEEDEKSGNSSTAIIIVLTLLIPVSFVGGLLAHILYSRCKGTMIPVKMKARPTSVYKVNELVDKRKNQPNNYYPDGSSTVNTMVHDMYHNSEPASDAVQSSKCVETPKLEDEYVVISDQEEMADLKTQASDAAGKLNENPYYEGFGEKLQPTDEKSKMIKDNACIKGVGAPKLDGEIEDNPYYEGIGNLTTTGNEKGTVQPKITDNLQRCGSNDIEMSPNGKYHSALSEQKVPVEGVEMADNPYYDGTGELNHKTPTQLSEKKVPSGDDMEMTDNPYYDGTGNLEMSNMERPNQNAKGKDKEGNYVYTYGHFKLEGRQREDK